MTAPRSWAALAAILGLSLALGACGAIGGPSVSSTAKCDGPAFTSGTAPAAPTRTVVLVDLESDGEAARERVVEAIDPLVSRSVEGGGVIRLLISGGEGQPLSPSPCLDGSSTILVDRNNGETERRARSTAVKAIEGDVSALLEETTVAARGNLSTVLAAVPEQLAKLAGGRGPRSVLLVSDLTGAEAGGDCLNLHGLQALPRVAREVVKRCFKTRQLRRLPAGVGLSIVRPQALSEKSPEARMGNYLSASLCAQLPADGSGCQPEPTEEGEA